MKPAKNISFRCDSVLGRRALDVIDDEDVDHAMDGFEFQAVLDAESVDEIDTGYVGRSREPVELKIVSAGESSSIEDGTAQLTS